MSFYHLLDVFIYNSKFLIFLNLIQMVSTVLSILRIVFGDTLWFFQTNKSNILTILFKITSTLKSTWTQLLSAIKFLYSFASSSIIIFVLMYYPCFMDTFVALYKKYLVPKKSSNSHPMFYVFYKSIDDRNILIGFMYFSYVVEAFAGVGVYPNDGKDSSFPFCYYVS